MSDTLSSMTNQVSAPSGSDQPLEDRVNNRSQRPTSQVFKQFMASQWATDTSELPALDQAASYAATRRAALSAAFPGERLIIPAGPLKVRSNDTDYRFRPHSAFAHLTGLGVDHEPDAVLVLEPTEDGAGDNNSHHTATLFFAPMAGRDSSDFYLDSRSGEFWVGPRPTLATMTARTGLPTQGMDQLELALTKDAGPQALGGIRIRLVREVDLNVEALVDTSRINTGQDLEASDSLDNELAEFVSEMRLIKDEYEINELQKSVDATIAGFADVVRNLDRAIDHQRGERIVEGTFFARARLEGNDLGYDTIAASGNNATILHWIRNNGAVNAGEVLLLDAGVEAESLYTADITRSLPVSGTYSPVQRKIYEAVLEAADATFAAARPGLKFRDLHIIATTVLAERLNDWGLLPVSLEEALSPEGQHHRRWMPHGTSHHLGLDVHDCAQARAELYLDSVLKEGMVFTIEPGLYFKKEDLAIPEEFRGIGVRIEDDILITADGAVNLSAALPRKADEVEAWMASLRG